MYKVIHNKGLGFTEYTNEFETIVSAFDDAITNDNSQIYKDNERIA